MIRNDSDYKAAVQKMAEQALRLREQERELRKMGLDRDQVKRAMDPLRSFHAQLREEVAAYEQLEPDSSVDGNGLGHSMLESTYLKSNFYEQLVEHVFISEVLQEVWFGFGQTVEVLRSEVDSSGFDVVFECNGILRHVQLKTSRINAKRQSQNVNSALARKPSGCVVWLVRDEDQTNRRIRLSYLFFGAGPGERLPAISRFRIGKHAKGDATGKKKERPAIRLVPKSQFTRIESIRSLVERLFGLRVPSETAERVDAAMG